MGLDTIIFGAYAATLSLLAMYGLHRLVLLLHFRWDGNSESFPAIGELPRVTVQLPIYNERTVAARLMRAVGALDYPRERLEIQVLDDSTDDTVLIVDEEARRLRELGLAVQVVRRRDRNGFKAGALEHGLATATGELICIFDADFVPGPDFLRRLVGVFADPRIGMVQARWGHINRGEGWLTRAQAVLLDGHFVLEHKVRFDAGLFFNFNGTAGIWRRAAIESSGGWQHDTLTEDLDLSYRAQLKGWKLAYAVGVVAPGELPADIADFKTQQHRWAKGSVQVLRKLSRSIVTSREPLAIKLEAMVHLSGNAGYPFVLMMALLIPASIGVQPDFSPWLHFVSFPVCTLAVILFYERSQRVLGRTFRERAADTLAAVALGIGMSVNQTWAVLGGLLPGTGAFVRTAKRGDASLTRRYRSAVGGLPGVELALASWSGWGGYLAIREQMWGALPVLLLFFASFAWVGSLSLRDWIGRSTRSWSTPPIPTSSTRSPSTATVP